MGRKKQPLTVLMESDVVRMGQLNFSTDRIVRITGLSTRTVLLILKKHGIARRKHAFQEDDLDAILWERGLYRENPSKSTAAREIARAIRMTPGLSQLVAKYPINIERIDTGIIFIPTGQVEPVLQLWENGVISIDYDGGSVSVPDINDFELWFKNKKAFHKAWRQHVHFEDIPDAPDFGFVRELRKEKTRSNPLYR